MIPHHRGDQRGSVLPLILGCVLVLSVLVAVVVDASAAYLRRQELDSVADAAALAATDGLQGEAVYTQGLGRRATIDPAAARSYVAGYLRDSGAARSYPGLRLHVTTTSDTVVVHLSARLHLPLHVAGVGRSTTVGATAASVVSVRR